MEIKLPKPLLKLREAAKSPIFVVGGFVRNSMCGLPLSDFDICGQLMPHHLEITGYKIIPVNPKLGTVLITDGEDKFEYTPFRIENYVAGEHTPSEVSFTSDMKLDAARRDFSANAVYLNLMNGQLVDFFGGIDDIQNRVLRAVTSGEQVFSSDGLRLMRLARIAAETGFSVEPTTMAAAQKYAHLLFDISRERVAIELKRILAADTKYGVEDAHYKGVSLLGEIGLYKYFLPEVQNMMGVTQNPKYHKYDVYNHSLQAVRFAPLAVRLAALLHDIGKPEAVLRDGNMYDHASIGAKMVKRALGSSGLKMSTEEIDHTVWLVENHMYDKDGMTKDSKVRLFVAQNYDRIDDLTALMRADILATGTKYHAEKHRRLEFVKQQLIEQNVPIRLSDLKIDGTAVIECGAQGAMIGKVLRELHRQCVLSPQLNNEEWLIKQAKKLIGESK